MLFSVLIMEIIGPFLTKISLQKAGEIAPEERVSHRGATYHRHHHFHMPHFVHKHPKEEIIVSPEGDMTVMSGEAEAVEIVEIPDTSMSSETK